MLVELYALLCVDDSKLDKMWSLPSTELMAKTKYGIKVGKTKDFIGIMTDRITNVLLK